MNYSVTTYAKTKMALCWDAYTFIYIQIEIKITYLNLDLQIYMLQTFFWIVPHFDHKTPVGLVAIYKVPLIMRILWPKQYSTRMFFCFDNSALRSLVL